MSEVKSINKADIVAAEPVCEECGAVAARMEVVPPGAKHPKAGSDAKGDIGVYDGLAKGEGGTYIVAWPVARTAFAVPSEYVEPVGDVLRRADWPALFKVDPEFVPTWCPECSAHYCKNHWLTWPVFDDGFYDCTRGECPKGHRRIIDD